MATKVEEMILRNALRERMISRERALRWVDDATLPADLREELRKALADPTTRFLTAPWKTKIDPSGTC